MTKPQPICFLTDARGVYIPRDFANAWDTTERKQLVTGPSDEDWSILEAGPDHEHYWDTWSDVCDTAIVTDNHGHEYGLNQDGDLWLIPVGMEWSEATDGWVWPEEDKDND